MSGMGAMKGILVSWAAIGFCLPQAAWATPWAVDRRPILIDVALADGGVLRGQVVDPQGVGVKNVMVSLRHRGREVQRTTTNTNGVFEVRGLQGGVYQIVAAQGHGAYRLWTPGNAPPLSQQAALLVAGGETARGQFGNGALGWLANPWVIAGIVATSVAVPVAIHNSRRPTSP